MPSVKVFNMAGKEVSTMELSEAVFGAEVNGVLLHSAVRAYLNNQRQGTQSTLTRTEVSGGGKKPWRQKGTGRARQGSTRSRQWTHGGVALGPKPRKYTTLMNKKAKRAALVSALSSKVAEGKLVVVDQIVATEYKTKTMAEMLKALNCKGSALVVLSEKNDYAIGSCANLPKVETTDVTKAEDGTVRSMLNVYGVMKAQTVVIAADAVKMLEEVYAK